MTDSFWAYGSQLQLSNGAVPPVWMPIAELTEIVPPKMKRDAIDVSNHDSPDGYREFIPGWRDGGEAEAKGNWLPEDTSQDEVTGLLSTFNDDEVHEWRIVLPDGENAFQFDGFLTAFEPELPMEEQAQMSTTIKLSGKPEFVAV